MAPKHDWRPNDDELPKIRGLRRHAWSRRAQKNPKRELELALIDASDEAKEKTT